MKTPALPLTISGHDVLGVILRRNRERENLERIGRMLGFNTRKRRTHRAQLGDKETVESNLPLP